ncbi:hypothetical protein PAPHI01_0288 [Pancytospora philotis]|nr:hypothetical protein PAPHI01_0288 [Pancytospora philotis]
MGQANNPTWSSRFISSLWSETTQTWDSSAEDWRVVGSNPFKGREDKKQSVRPVSDVLYIVEFSSGRLGIAHGAEDAIQPNVYVIVEADRGEDCGLVIGITTMSMYIELLNKYRIAHNEFKVMKIFRVASQANMEVLEERKRMIHAALAECRCHVRSKRLSMEILDCEYQFDLNKITFFYRSNERIDFRELVRDLYKVFKTRIWMCSVDKSKDKYLGCLMGKSLM